MQISKCTQTEWLAALEAIVNLKKKKEKAWFGTSVKCTEAYD